MTRFFVAVAVMIAAAAPASADDLDDFVNAAIRQRNIPGVAIAVVKDGALVRTGGYGLADRERNVAPGPDTVFRIGSLSKQFIATGIMLLVQDGTLMVGDRLEKHLAGVPQAWHDITIRHLLTHTSGLRREAPSADLSKAQPDIDLIRSAYDVPLQWQPGDKYDYSNLGYYVLAEVITRVSGMPWHEFIAKRVFQPLGMTRTTTTSDAGRLSNRASGYVWRDGTWSAAPALVALRPSGAFVSTATDLAKWAVALEGDRVLSKASKAEMWKPVTLNDGGTFPYGFGWELDDFPPGGHVTGVPMIRHEGTIPGFRPGFTRLPKQGLTIIVMTNLDRGAVDAIIAGIAVRYAPELIPDALRQWKDRTALGLK
jgi:CubicO group peptidase (beta-lactamase class C family)